MNITLRHLTYFRALCETGHFGKAAEACAVSQPALSVQIQELEEILGAPLIDRSHRPFAPTPFGREILAKSGDILEQVAGLSASAQLKRGIEGPFSLGIIPTVAPYILPETLSLITKGLPNLEIQIREATTVEILSELSAGKLDACVLATDPGGPQFTDRPLFEDRFLLAVSKTEATRHALTDQHITLSDIANLRLLLLSEGHCLREQAQSVCRFASAETLNQIGASSLQTLMGLVAANYGVTLIPEIALENGTSPRTSILRLAKPEPQRTIRLVSRSGAGATLHLDILQAILTRAGNARIQETRDALDT